MSNCTQLQYPGIHSFASVQNLQPSNWDCRKSTGSINIKPTPVAAQQLEVLEKVHLPRRAGSRPSRAVIRLGSQHMSKRRNTCISLFWNKDVLLDVHSLIFYWYCCETFYFQIEVMNKVDFAKYLFWVVREWLDVTWSPIIMTADSSLNSKGFYISNRCIIDFGESAIITTGPPLAKLPLPWRKGYQNVFPIPSVFAFIFDIFICHHILYCHHYIIIIYLLRVIKKLTSVLVASLKDSTKITLMSQVYETKIKWTKYNPICTKTFCRIFIQSFGEF